MNMRSDTFGAAPALAALRVAPPLEEAHIVPLTGDLTALFVDRPAGTGRRPRLSATLDAAPVAPPCIGCALALDRGGSRHLLIVRKPVAQVLSAHVLLILDGRAEAEARPDWLQPPLHALSALLHGLSAAGRDQFLRMFVTTAASLFAPRDGAALAGLARQLLDLCRTPVVPLLDCAAFGSGRAILSFGSAAQLRPGSAVVALRSDGVLRLPEAEIFAEDEARILHLHLGHRPVAGEEIVIFTPQPLRLAPTGAARPQPVAVWLDGRSAAVRDWTLMQVHAGAERDPMARALLQELRSPDLPIRFETLSLAATQGGVLYAFRLDDPERLVRSVRLERGGACLDLPPTPDPCGTSTLAGLALLPLPADGSDACRLHLVLGSGRLRALPEGRPSRYDGEEPEGFAAAWTEWRLNGTTQGADPAQALAAARRALARRPAATRVQCFGPDRTGRIRLMAPFGSIPDLIPARAAAIAAEARGRGAEMVLTAPEGPAARLARELAASAAEVHGIPHRIIAHSAEDRPIEVLRTALALAEGPVLLLGSDVLPTGTGWLTAWHRHLSRTSSLVTGGVVLDHQGAIAEAGDDLQEGHLVRLLAGLPASRLPEEPVAATLPSAGYAGLNRAGVQHFLGLPSSPASLELALAELAATDRAEGRTVQTNCHHPFIGFSSRPAPEGFPAAILVHGLRLIGAAASAPENAR